MDAEAPKKPKRAVSAHDPMSKLEHTVRNSLIDRERTWTLGPDALHWKSNKREGRIACGDIAKVRLIAYTSAGGEAFQCTLSVRGLGKVKIRSHSYISLGNFEDRSATYTPFMRQLLVRVAAASPKTEFIAGSTGLLIAWLVVLLLFILGAVTLILAYFEGLALTWKFALLVGVLLLSAPILWRRLVTGGVYRFDPADPPRELIGD